jgi:hypothetical protein
MRPPLLARNGAAGVREFWIGAVLIAAVKRPLLLPPISSRRASATADCGCS